MEPATTPRRVRPTVRRREERPHSPFEAAKTRIARLLRDRGVAWTLVAGAAGAAFVFVFVVLPPLLVPADVGATEAERVKLRNDVRSSATQFLGGLALVTGLLFTARTLRLNREGQLTDRFGKAIDQLGDDKLDVRLGGIYALERIARDSKRDHGPVMEVLTAFVRRYVRTDWDPETPPPYDVQSIMIVLGRRERSHDPPDYRLDLRSADLRAIRITGDLGGALLGESDLTGAVVDANLTNAVLIGARAGAMFLESNLRRLNARGADFSDAGLPRTDLTDVLYDEKTLWPAYVDPTARDARELPSLGPIGRRQAGKTTSARKPRSE